MCLSKPFFSFVDVGDVLYVSFQWCKAWAGRPTSGLLFKLFIVFNSASFCVFHFGRPSSEPGWVLRSDTVASEIYHVSKGFLQCQIPPSSKRRVLDLCNRLKWKNDPFISSYYPENVEYLVSHSFQGFLRFLHLLRRWSLFCPTKIDLLRVSVKNPNDKIVYTVSGFWPFSTAQKKFLSAKMAVLELVAT